MPPTDPRLPFGDGGPPGDAAMARDLAARGDAVDPSRNVVLEASAGTGKTSVLVTRYLNLLRAGIDPANILAITFTRKAAAEMRERILRQAWELASLLPADAASWRPLAERLVDVTVSTIDAFCFSLLREFPLEADLDPTFDMADETERPRLVDEALDGAIGAAGRLAATDADVAFLLATVGERRLRGGLAALVDRRLVVGRAIRRFLGATAAPHPSLALDRAMERLGEVLASGDGGLEAFLRDGPAGHPAFELLGADLRLRGGPAPRAALDRVARYFLTDRGDPRGRPARTYRKDDCASPAAWSRHSRLVATLAPLVSGVVGAFERDVNVAMVRGVWRLFRIVRRRYLQALEAQAVVDFPEGLARALRLLGQMDEFAQSRYRLEARYHHVLVDEFQDTSRAQWGLVARLIESWGEGVGLAHDAPLQPSIFIVGDRKQSIYAFRDADVRMLRRARRYVGALRPGGDVRRSIARSFRSAPPLLAFANDVFSSIEITANRADAFRYRLSDRFPVPPASATAQVPARPAGARASGPPGETPFAPLGLVTSDDPQRVADVIAAEIEQTLATAVVRDRESGVPRPVRPGDIAILFRSRESHRDIEAALEARGIPAYVYKGLGFFDADEVKDLVALLRYLADPSSDVRSAAFLRSRFVRLSDPALRSLSPRLAAALTEAEPPAVELPAEDALVIGRLRASLGSWLELADRVPPAELLDRVLDEGAFAFELGGRRLAQARENLKKIRALTRRLQNRGYATLARIADHLDRLSAGDESNAVVDALDAVNLMTVHAAKGLEFPIVFVVNLARGTGGRGDPIVVVSGGAGGVPMVSVAGSLREADQAVSARDREETKRLLYVAVTRARERLYLCAVLKSGRFAAGPGSLGEVLPVSLRAAFEQAATTEADAIEWRAESGGVHGLRIARAGTHGSAMASQGVQAAGGTPSFDFDPVPEAALGPRVSAVAYAMALEAGGGRDGASPPPGEPRSDPEATVVGTLVHRLFQVSAGHAVAAGAGVAACGPDEALLRARVGSWLQDEEFALASDSGRLAASAVETFLALRRRSDVTGLLGTATCLYEVPFSLSMAGPASAEPGDHRGGPDGPAIGGGRVIVRGVIDCLARCPDGRIVVLEIKTGRRRAWHRSQLDLYVRAARVLFPDATVEGRVVYSDRADRLADQS